MKRNGLRALGLAACTVTLVSLIGFAAVDLNSIVANELIEEISKAAGLALVDSYTLKTVEELETLAASGRTPGIRLAADRALYIVTGEEMALFAKTNDELLALANAGDHDAADMYMFKIRTRFVKPTQVEEFLLTVTSDAVARAAGKLLGGFYVPGSPIGAKTEAELIALAKNGESLGLRVAAATALTAIWIESKPLTIDQTRSAILGVTLQYPELAYAYQGYLAYLFSI